MKRKKPTKEELDFMIYDLGFYESLDHYSLTEEEAEVILFGKPESAPARRVFTESEKQEQAPTLSIHVKHLKRVLTLNYEQLYIESGAFITKIVNSQGLSRYDIFSEAVQRLLWSNRDYYYMNDDQTMNYIRHRLRRSLSSASRNLRRFNNKVKKVETFKDPYFMPDFEVNRDIEVLTLREREIAELKAEGYNQTEIAYMIDCDQSTVCKKLKRIYKKLRSA